METIGERVRRLRESKGIERKDLALAAGLSYSGLSDLESSKARSSTKLHRIAQALGVTSNFLETGKEDARGAAVLGDSQSVRLDAEMILDVVHSLQEVFKEIGLVYSVEDEPGLFAEFLADRIAMRDIRSVEAKAKVGKWLKRGVAQGGVDERASQVPSKGAHKGKTGGGRAKG
jgi:transcriptional regulator with XRE-family HTH domain